MEIKKLDYSVNPWRLLDSEGRELPCLTRIKTNDGDYIVYESTVSGRTKKECIENTLNYLEKALSALKDFVDQTNSMEDTEMA